MSPKMMMIIALALVAAYYMYSKKNGGSVSVPMGAA